MKISEGAKKIAEVLNKFEELNKAANQDFTYWVKQIYDANVYLTNKYCQYEKGEKVLLAKTPEIKQGHGWYHHRHFLVKGTEAVINDIGCGVNGFYYYLSFPSESWVPDYGEDRSPQLTPNKHLFCLNEEYVKKIESPRQNYTLGEFIEYAELESKRAFIGKVGDGPKDSVYLIQYDGSIILFNEKNIIYNYPDNLFNKHEQRLVWNDPNIPIGFNKFVDLKINIES